MKNIAWIVIIFICGIASWQYIVNKNDRIEQDRKYEALENRLTDTLKDYGRYREWADSALNNATATAIQAGEQAQTSKHWLDVRQKRINELLKVLDSAENEKLDSSLATLVSKRFKAGCDSLRLANIVLGKQIWEYEQDNQTYVDALNYETTIRDSALQKERGFSAAFRGQLVYCIDALKEASKAKKKTQLYAGMAAWGNGITPLGGGEINLGLKTGNDQFYEIKGAYIGQWWIGIGTKFKISLK